MTERTRIVVVGRPNVGKSTLFNRLLGRRRALVHDLPGVTRDRLEEKAQWWVKGVQFPALLVDTGGVGGDRFAEEVERQVELAVEEADVVLMVFDAQTGLTPLDTEVLARFQRSGLMDRVPFIGVVNKVDDEKHEMLQAEFFATGLDRIVTLSAEHGRGIDELTDMIAEVVGFDPTAQPAEAEPGEADTDEKERKIPHIAIVGRPNVGKSTTVNALLGQERMITSPIPGTTVDAVDTAVEIDGRPFILVDTAGIRRKSKTEQGIEVLSVVQARKALERADVALLLLDGEAGPTDQDEKIGGLIEEVGCSVILCVNKWDTQRRNREFTRETAAEQVRKAFGFLKFAPILFTSAKRGEGYDGLGELIDDIIAQKRVKIATKEFTEWVRKESEIHNPFNAKFYMCHQSGRHPPTFVCHVSDPEKVHFSLKRHLVNALRERWGYMGTPIRMLFVKGKSDR